MEEKEQDPILKIRDVSVSFDMSRGKAKVLNDVSLDVYRNEILGVVGESGSGKSMLASSILDAVIEPGKTSGEIWYHPKDGDPFDILSLSAKGLRNFRWNTISMVYQGAMSSFNPTLTIESHFRETLRAHDDNVREGMKRAEQLLADLYLDPIPVLESYPHELSGGMRQRALIALSLILEPEVLVMDEPTAALDLLMQRSIIDLLEDVHDKYDLTLIFITHDLPLVGNLTDRLAVLYAFDIAEIGQTKEIIAGAAHPYTRALINAIPSLHASIDEMKPIEGSSPDPVNIPVGCSYHPRCPLADSKCEETDPAFDGVTETHQVRCWHWERATTIPMNIQ